MSGIFRNILEDQRATYSREGYTVVSEGLAREDDPAYIIRQMPVADRIRLYIKIVDPQNPAIKDVSPDAYHEIVSAIGSAINLKNPDTLTAAVEAILGRAEIREKKDSPEGSKVKSDGYQSADERLSQIWLAYALSSNLPNATGTKPDIFIKKHLDEAELGIALALLSVKTVERHNQVQAARDLLLAESPLSPILWNAFYTTCRELDKNLRGDELENKAGYYADTIERLIDTVAGREICKLRPEQIKSLPDNRAYNYLFALNGFGGVGSLTPEFLATRAYFHKHLNVGNEFAKLRSQQIDKFVSFFSGQSDEEINRWADIKMRWHTMSSAEKTDALKPYYAILGNTLGTPQLPDVIVSSWANIPDLYQSNTRPNGYFIGWRNVKAGDKNEEKWLNTVVLPDDTSEDGEPLSAKKSFRSGVSLSTHEFLHSDYGQYVNRSGPGARHAKYMAVFSDDAKPSQITFSHALGYAVNILDITDGIVGSRKKYVAASENFDAYSQQPSEKWVSSYQNQFTAALNGTIVSRQVERGERILHEDLGDTFKKLSQVLTARKALIGHNNDLMPFMNYDRDEHPFGALATRDAEAVENAAKANAPNNYVAVDFSQYNGKADILAYLQKTLDKQKADGANKDADYLPLFLQSADFLAQMPKELWAIKKHLTPEESALAVKLDSLATKCQELSEDLSDYAFIEKSLQRPKVVASLIATL